jgi:hypothetical protein
MTDSPQNFGSQKFCRREKVSFFGRQHFTREKNRFMWLSKKFVSPKVFPAKIKKIRPKRRRHVCYQMEVIKVIKFKREFVFLFVNKLKMAARLFLLN